MAPPSENTASVVYSHCTIPTVNFSKTNRGSLSCDVWLSWPFSPSIRRPVPDVCTMFRGQGQIMEIVVSPSTVQLHVWNSLPVDLRARTFLLTILKINWRRSSSRPSTDCAFEASANLARYKCPYYYYYYYYCTARFSDVKPTVSIKCWTNDGQIVKRKHVSYFTSTTPVTLD